jgi:hypothetical protein
LDQDDIAVKRADLTVKIIKFIDSQKLEYPNKRIVIEIENKRNDEYYRTDNVKTDCNIINEIKMEYNL